MKDKIAPKERAQIEKRAQIDKLLRFINALDEKKWPDPEAMTAGVFLCVREINRLGKGPGRKRLKSYTIDTPQFTVAMDRARGILTYEEARLRIAELSNCDERHAERFLAEMKPRAERTAASLYPLMAEAIARRKGDE